MTNGCGRLEFLIYVFAKLSYTIQYKNNTIIVLTKTGPLTSWMDCSIDITQEDGKYCTKG